MNKRTSISILGGLTIALLLLSCGRQQQAAPDTRAEDAAAIRQADIAWAATAESKQMDGPSGFFSFILDDGMILAPNAPMLSGRVAFNKGLGEMFATPGFSVRWQVSTAEAARSGDMGYSMGTYEEVMNDAKGVPVQDRGKYITIWKKQADGSWKVAADMFNSDLPLPAPPSK